MNPNSQFYLAFNLGYPNNLERALGYHGAALMVHGACTSSGCYAMTDDGIAEVYAVARDALAAGQPAFQVQALPFRMTPRNFALNRNDPNMPFWRNLKEGTDVFAVTRQPPNVSACGGRYRFTSAADPAFPNEDPLAPCLQEPTDPQVAAIGGAARGPGRADHRPAVADHPGGFPGLYGWRHASELPRDPAQLRPGQAGDAHLRQGAGEPP